jgi:hypothetical protein
MEGVVLYKISKNNSVELLFIHSKRAINVVLAVRKKLTSD